MRLNPHVLTLGSFLVLALLAGGCGSDHGDLTQPQVAPSGSPSGDLQLLNAPIPMYQPLASGPRSVSANIRARDGGLLVLGNIKVRIPQRALREDRTVTLSRLDGEEVRFSITPADLVLQVPVDIVVDQLFKTDYKAFESLSILVVDPVASRALPTSRSLGRVQASSSRLGDFAVGTIEGAVGEIVCLRYLEGSGYTTEYVRADHNTEVRHDRFRLFFPAGSLPEDTYITIRNPGNGYLMCELEPHGIQFLQPVTLEMDLRGLGYQPFMDWSIFWLNDQTGEWEDQSGSFGNEKVRVSLMHFSTYAGGRVGW